MEPHYQKCLLYFKGLLKLVSFGHYTPQDKGGSNARNVKQVLWTTIQLKGGQAFSIA